MSVLKQARAELATALRTVVPKAEDHEPERFSPPVALVAPLTPYLTEPTPRPFQDQFQLQLRVRIVVPVAPAGVVTDQLDELAVAAVAAVESIDRDGPDGWTVVDVSEHYTLVAGSAAYPAIDLTCRTSVRL